MQKKGKGFTLIELLIVIVVIAILVSIAFPIYQSYIRKSRRTDATSTLLSLQLAEEKYRFNNVSYGSLAQIWSSTTSSNGYYTLSITNIGANTYTLTATATGDQANDSQNGISCATMTITFNNGTSTQSPTACWQ